MLQALLYDYLYLTSRNLKRRAVQTFVASSHTPQKEVLAYFGYEATEFAGIYHSQDKWLKRIDLLVLNQLSNEPHNVFFKCFASRKKEREAAFAVIDEMKIWTWSEALWATVSGLRSIYHRLEGGEMKDVILTPEYLRKLGEGIRDSIIASLTPEQRLGGMSVEAIVAQLTPEQLLAKFGPEQLLAKLNPEQRLAGLDPEVIEGYLRKQKQAEEAHPHHSKPSTRRKPKKTASPTG